ncbi:unnamed protein product, partial [Tilletia caries]
LRLKAQGS